MGYRQITEEERYKIASMRGVGAGPVAIARELGRDRRTISREVLRNRSVHDGAYRAMAACEKARARQKRSRRNKRYGPEEFGGVEAMLREDFSPQQVVGRLRLEGVKPMSHETIYVWIWADKKTGGTLWRHLRGAGKQRRKRYGRNDNRGRAAGKKPISERPKEVDARNRIGDWEIDTVHGQGKPCVVTVVERKSGLLRLGKLPTAGSKQTLERTCQIMAREPHPIHTITSDNGTEFHCFKELEAKLHTQVFFAVPHHAWERGTNENTNGLLRQFLPRGTSFENLSQRQCNVIAERLNNRPRRRHGYRTPNEVYYASHDLHRCWAASCGKLYAPVLGSGPTATPSG